MNGFSAAPDADAPPEGPAASSRWWWRVLRAIVIAWCGFVVLLALAQRSMIYYPSRQDAAILAREAASQGFEPWKNAAGETIGYCSVTAPEDPRPPLGVLVFHGNAGYALHRTGFAPLLRGAAPDRAVSVYILEYPGYGARHGNPSQDSFLSAAREAVATLPGKIPLIILGESIGTAVAAAAASADPARVGGLLLLTPFDSLVSVAQHHYPLLPVRWILRDQYPAAEWLENYRGPVTVVLAANDTIVPAAFGKKLHDSHAGPKKVVTVTSADHNDVVEALPTAFWREAMDFLLSR